MIVRFLRPAFLEWAALAAFAVSILMAPMVPIYLDEVGWRMITGRYLQDGGVMISLFPRCGASFATAPPAFMTPVRLAEGWISGGSPPLQIRFMAIAALLTWFAVVAALLPRATAGLLQRRRAMALMAAGIGLGGLPLVLVMNRPEQVLLIGLTLLMLVPLALPDRRPRWVDWIMSLGAVGTIMVMLAAHPKALLFTPLVAVSLFLLVRSWPLRVTSLVVAGVFAAHGYAFWSTFGSCPDDPVFAAYLSSQMIQLSDLAARPVDTVGDMLVNLGNSFYYAKALQAAGGGVLPWLLPGPAIPEALMWAVTGIVCATAGAGLAIGAVALWHGMRNAWNERRIPRRLALLVALVVSVAGLSAVQSAKNFYEISLLGPLAVLAVLVALPLARGRGARVARAVGAALMGVAVLSQAVLWGDMLAREEIGYFAGGYAPSRDNVHSVSAFRWPAVEAHIKQTARMCGIDPASPPPRLVVDTLSYPALSGGQFPYHLFFALAGPRSPHAWLTGPELSDFLREKRAGGVVAACSLLPPDMKGRVVRNGTLCCMPSFDGAESDTRADVAR